MRVILFTDSLSLPRKHKGGIVQWEQIYPNLLKKRFPDSDIVHIGIGGATISELLRLQNYYSLIPADIVVLHCGIVDCTPRALGKLEQEIIKKLHLVRFFNPFIGFLRKTRKLTYTSPKKFEKTLSDLIARYPGIPFVTIGILPGNTEYEKIAPGINFNINTYNKILKSKTEFIDNSDFPSDAILPDHHHLNEKGHQVIADKLSRKISEYL